MKKQNRLLIIAIIVISMIVILEVAWILGQEEHADIQQEQNHTEEQQIQDNQIVTEDVTIPAVTAVDGTAEIVDATEPSETDPEESTQDTIPNQEQKPQSKPNNSYRFPYTIAGSTLVIEQIESYDGLFFEDGSDRDVTNITAMVLTNTGDDCIEYVEIKLDRNGTKLRFTASAIEPGATVIVLEAEGRQFSEGEYSNCRADVAMIDGEMIMSQNKVRVEESPEGGLLVTNLTDADIPCVRIFYKFYMDDTGVYVGGITYTAKVVDLAAGSTCSITPSHYLQGYSKIVMIKTYDTAD